MNSQKVRAELEEENDAMSWKLEAMEKKMMMISTSGVVPAAAPSSLVGVAELVGSGTSVGTFVAVAANVTTT